MCYVVELCERLSCYFYFYLFNTDHNISATASGKCRAMWLPGAELTRSLCTIVCAHKLELSKALSRHRYRLARFALGTSDWASNPFVVVTTPNNAVCYFVATYLQGAA